MSGKNSRVLCYDAIVNGLEYAERQVENLWVSGGKLNKEMEEDFAGRLSLLRCLRDEAKIFWVDEMTLDSLVNQPFSVDHFDDFEFRFPFPVMFIDFGEDLEYRLLEKRDQPTNFKIGGMLLSKVNVDFMQRGLFPNTEGFTARAFRNDGEGPVINVSYLDGMIIINEGVMFDDVGAKEIPHWVDTNTYWFRGNESQLYEFVPKRPHEEFREAVKQPGFSGDNFYTSGYKEFFDSVPRDYQMQDDDILDGFKLANLVINTVEYINAQNIIIREQRRTREEKRRVGRGKDRHLEKIQVELKPYYWVEVKKVHIDRERRKGEPEWTVNCRFWVRGHSRYYRDADRREKYHIWVEPFVKGPEDAPWKNNRYEVLWKRFRPLFENPELRRGPWAMREIQRELDAIREEEGR